MREEFALCHQTVTERLRIYARLTFPIAREGDRRQRWRLFRHCEVIPTVHTLECSCLVLRAWLLATTMFESTPICRIARESRCTPPQHAQQSHQPRPFPFIDAHCNASRGDFAR